jgi:hypothetical protein
MIRKGQIRWVAGDDLPRQIEFIDHLFDLAACTYLQGMQLSVCA